MNSVGDKLYRMRAGKIGFAPSFIPGDRYEGDICVPGCPITTWRFIQLYPNFYEYNGGEEDLAPFTTVIGNVAVFKDVALDIAKRFYGVDLAALLPQERTPKKYLSVFEKYFEFIPEVRVPSSKKLIPFGKMTSCDKCGRVQVTPEGVELGVRQEKIGDRWEWVPGVPREAGKGILIPESLIGASNFIHCRYLLCTESVRNYVLSLDMNYVDFKEFGEIVEG